ncbi:cysteine desulfurase [Desemzia sp. FAM 23991]|uniref:cysteine desulfurase n=1 Tax=unclassified Desemzia TaxID=2685243 RepID=UPI003886E531
MAFLAKDKLDGSTDMYRMSESVKKYTLRDNGFEQSKNGHFQFSRDLEIGSAKSPKLKMTVASDLKTFKMSVVTANGLRSVNLYKGDAFKEAQDRAGYVLAGFVESGILEKV